MTAGTPTREYGCQTVGRGQEYPGMLGEDIRSLSSRFKINCEGATRQTRPQLESAWILFFLSRLLWSPEEAVSGGRGVACDFCRVSLVTSVPVSLVTSQSLPLQIAAVSLLADLWLPWRPFLALLSLLSLFHLLPSILFHGAQDAHEDLPMMPMRLIVLMLCMLLL